ncbi:hypothetical protein P9314_05215 [Paenibacillus validus]|uniref:hypothetical protein n=1 Tax=Paenibacillus validus TaxID=44253 RepID=UPI000FD8FDDE|nr:hypothetical protein [Paenibacillus validus]MED4600109.1 hypothetical protein [Paenibacillus validus]
MNQRKIGFIQGVCYSASMMQRANMDAERLLKESGLSVSDIREYADDFDLEVLESVLAEIEETK